MSMIQPIIKWSGSKRSQADELIQYFPDEIDTYYEPFCGGCSMMRRLLDSDVKFNKIVCSDFNADLIALWKEIQLHPNDVFWRYTELWMGLQECKDLDEKKKYFEKRRYEYNMTHDPLIFFFIMRTTTNGMPRYNARGEFNNSFHITRNGITPENLKPILLDWHQKLNQFDIEFRHCSYEKIFGEAKKDDFLYLDPPYYNTKGMYYGTIDFDQFFNELYLLNQKGMKYMMSFDGKSGDVDNTSPVPENCYKKHLYIKSGNSSFKRTTGNDKHAIVYESLYLNFEKEGKLF